MGACDGAGVEIEGATVGTPAEVELVEFQPDLRDSGVGAKLGAKVPFVGAGVEETAGANDGANAPLSQSYSTWYVYGTDVAY